MNTDMLIQGARQLGLTKRQKFIYDSDDEFEGWYTEVGKYSDGYSFGELALISSKPRAATILWTKDTHFAIISKEDYQQVIGKIQKDNLNKKVDFLKNIPWFSFLGRTTLGKFSYFFKEK